MIHAADVRSSSEGLMPSSVPVRALAYALACLFVLASCTSHRPTRSVLLIGNSITYQYGPVLQVMAAQDHGPSVTLRALPGSNARDTNWKQWLQPADVVVLEDWAVDVPHPFPTYCQAWQDLVDRARAQHSRVFVIDSPNPCRVHGAHYLTPPKPDAGDGIHYGLAGRINLARLVLRQL